MTKLRKIALAVAATLLPAAASYGAEPAPSPTRNLSGLVGVDFKTDYISRGLVLENQGFIAQPYGELAFKLMESKEGLQKLSLYGGIWNSLHSEHTDEEGDRPGAEPGPQVGPEQVEERFQVQAGHGRHASWGTCRAGVSRRPGRGARRPGGRCGPGADGGPGRERRARARRPS